MTWQDLRRIVVSLLSVWSKSRERASGTLFSHPGNHWEYSLMPSLRKWVVWCRAVLMGVFAWIGSTRRQFFLGNWSCGANCPSSRGHSPPVLNCLLACRPMEKWWMPSIRGGCWMLGTVMLLGFQNAMQILCLSNHQGQTGKNPTDRCESGGGTQWGSCPCHFLLCPGNKAWGLGHPDRSRWFKSNVGGWPVDGVLGDDWGNDGLPAQPERDALDVLLLTQVPWQWTSHWQSVCWCFSSKRWTCSQGVIFIFA